MCSRSSEKFSCSMENGRLAMLKRANWVAPKNLQTIKISFISHTRNSKTGVWFSTMNKLAFDKIESFTVYLLKISWKLYLRPIYIFIIHESKLMLCTNFNLCRLYTIKLLSHYYFFNSSVMFSWHIMLTHYYYYLFIYLFFELDHLQLSLVMSYRVKGIV